MFRDRVLFRNAVERVLHLAFYHFVSHLLALDMMMASNQSTPLDVIHFWGSLTNFSTQAKWRQFWLPKEKNTVTRT